MDNRNNLLFKKAYETYSELSSKYEKAYAEHVVSCLL